MNVPYFKCNNLNFDLQHLPSTREAYQEIQRHRSTARLNWSHLVVQYTANRLNASFLTIKNEQKAYAIFKRTYLNVCHLARLGILYMKSEDDDQDESLTR